ncbi:hypothetical protein ATANTOWER_016978 [Ataeniobius toweri]|uniref:Uncharacterized protein n=1 Tax=Ataeniobius toweri TaxID=208326 RepID=A0ABU7B9P6_9TELE|nr:hypothetical protein [Ataeniobius toweri]
MRLWRMTWRSGEPSMRLWGPGRGTLEQEHEEVRPRPSGRTRNPETDPQRQKQQHQTDHLEAGAAGTD